MEVHCFYGLASFYRRFPKDFSSIIAPLTGRVKKGTFEWTKATQRAFESIKGRLCLAPILALPNFKLLFEVKCDASRARIGAVLTQANCPLAYFSEKLNGSRFLLMIRSFMPLLGLWSIGIITLSPSLLYSIRITRLRLWLITNTSWIQGMLSGLNSFNPSLFLTSIRMEKRM